MDPRVLVIRNIVLVIGCLLTASAALGVLLDRYNSKKSKIKNITFNNKDIIREFYIDDHPAALWIGRRLLSHKDWTILELIELGNDAVKEDVPYAQNLRSMLYDIIDKQMEKE